MSRGQPRDFYKGWYVKGFTKFTSIVLAFTFAVASPLSLGVAYAQTTSDVGLQTAEPPTETTTTDQGGTAATPTQSDLNFTPTGAPETSVSTSDASNSGVDISLDTTSAP